MTEDSRRFTDREVAMILERATDLEDAEMAPGARGLSLDDLREIAREVGISDAALTRAVATLDQGRGLRRSVGGAPAVRKSVRAVPGRLGEGDIGRLMRVVDDEVDTTGSITEALGSVRWTGRDRFKSTRVSVTPGEDETVIEVVEKAEPKIRRVTHLLPPAWALMLAAPLVDTLEPGVLGLFTILVAAVAIGLGVGRGAWTLLSAASGRRVEGWAEDLAEEAAQRLTPSVDPTATDSRSSRSSSRSLDTPSPDR
ncbi:MAG: hypothetical protein R3304_03450 [Longimicrobiales bacterium]|nr:hypothetical protein [Longimicrobiales bacterium]